LTRTNTCVDANFSKANRKPILRQRIFIDRADPLFTWARSIEVF
jgi:hypothetical protein